MPTAPGHAQRTAQDSATILMELGGRATNGETRESVEYGIVLLQQALGQLRHAADRTLEGTVLNNIGAAYRALGRPDSALVYYRRALRLRRASRDHSGEAITLNNIGAAHWALSHTDSALAYYAAALSAFHAADDRKSEGIVLNNMGVIYSEVGQTDSAVSFLSRALTIHQEVGNRSAAGNTMLNLGAVYRDIGQTDSARSHYTRALAISRDLGERLREASALNSLGALHADLGQVDSALVSYRGALALRHAARDYLGEAATLDNIGMLHMDTGQPDSALVYFRKALPIQRDAGDLRAVGTTLNNIGGVFTRLVKPDSALSYYEQSLATRRLVKDPAGECATLNNMGSIYEELGRPDSAYIKYRQALAACRAANYSRGEATILQGLGSLYNQAHHPDSARSYYMRALRIQREVNDFGGAAVTLNNLGLLSNQEAQFDSALAFFTSALAIQRAVRDRPGESATLSNIGSVYMDSNRTDSALAYFARAVALMRLMGDASGENITLANMGFVHHRARHDLSRAVAYYDSAASAARRIGRAAGGERNQLSFAEQHVRLYQEWALAWLGRGSELGLDSSDVASAALAASERGRAQVLRDLMRHNVPFGVPGAGMDPPSGGDMPAEGRTLAAAAVRAGVSALSYVITHDTLLVFVLVPGRNVEVVRTPVSRDTLAALVAEVRAALNDEAGWRAPAARLTELLLPAGLRARLRTTSELVIVPSGPLFLLPFAMLPLSSGSPTHSPGPTEFLGLRHALRYAPSLSVLADLEMRPVRLRATARPLVVGNPATPWVPMEGGSCFTLSTLSSAGDEARWVARRIGTTALTDSAATEGAVRARLGTATLVHLATHALAHMSDARARDSYIALASDGSHDGLLTVGEILDELPAMRAELVVLSACETGLGDLKQAEGTVGFQRAFLARGARGVLASLWSVNAGGSTKMLMQSFYGHWLRGQTRAEALRRAQMEVARSFPQPRDWAPFQIIGVR